MATCEMYILRLFFHYNFLITGFLIVSHFFFYSQLRVKMDGQRIKLQGRNGEKVCVEGLLVVYIVKSKLFTELISLA